MRMVVAVAVGVLVVLVAAGIVLLPAALAADSKSPGLKIIGMFPMMAFIAIIPAFIALMIIDPARDQMLSTFITADLVIALVGTFVVALADSELS
jgi:hypothetical protein